ncbi:SHOCT domain-containing protein [Horticoccus luteus]|uniref:SHOCT domain-containing protein n=1 Tax=Horticoccus luteus TaxID=2862869 RepID=A0A8F9TVW0_9BACT|nr:SHOCT domain-containing protein [Horticoccus luteus]QYM78724.1 SHOCT domain-containing protein [Horticoccus luteus]
MKPLVLTFLACCSLILAGCANPGVVQISPDTYFISRTDKGGIFGNASKMKAEVIHEANEFAAKQGKVAIPLSTQETPMAIGQFASFDYQFRVVDKDDPEAKRTALVPRADIVVEKTEKIAADVKTKEEKAPDLYTELTKLDDLRKKGIITDAEFEAAKKKLLEK